MNPYQQKLARIETNLIETQDLLRQYEQKLLHTADPREKAQIQADITFYKQREEELIQNWDEANQRLQDYERKQAEKQPQNVAAPPESPFQQHLAKIAGLLKQGTLVVALGPGVNQADRLPDQRWEQGQLYPPNPTEMAKMLAHQLLPCTVASSELVHVTQVATVMHSSGWLYDQLLPLLQASTYQPSSVHRFWASLPQLLQRENSQPCYPIFITTNYDDLLERAFDEAGQPFDLLSYSDEGNLPHFVHYPPDGKKPEDHYDPTKYLGVKPEERPVILKVYGVLDRLNAGQDKLVVTEDDFLRYMGRLNLANLLPKNLMNKLQRHSLLFLGYHLPDWNLRVVLHRLWEQRRNSYESYAVELNSANLEARFWRDFKVEVVEAGLKSYVECLKEYFEAGLSANKPEGQP